MALGQVVGRIKSICNILLVGAVQLRDFSL